MKQKILGLGLVALLLASALPAWAEKPIYQEQVFLTESQALKQVFGDLTLGRKTVNATEGQMQVIQKRLKRKLKEKQFTFYLGNKNGSPVRYALILNEKGKHFPMTFIVSLDNKARVEQVALMVYREKHGVEVRSKRFLSQFYHKNSQDAIKVNVDIIHLTGATISSWAIASGVKKAIVLTEELLLK